MAGIAILIPTIFFFGGALGSDDPYLCFEGITPVNGAIIPKHDLNLKTNGSKVKLICNLKPDGSYSEQGATIDDVLMLIRTDSTMEKSMLQRKERNETSVVYEFTPAHPGVFRVLCQINIKGANKSLCQRHINVGSAPQEPFDFQCISQNWQSLSCTWQTLPNAISTNHSIYYSEDGRFNDAPSHWSNGTKMPDNLFYLDLRTSIMLRQVSKSYQVIINQTNALAPEGVTKAFSFEFQKIVRPDPPEDLRILPDSRSLTITYNIPHELEYFPPGLKSRVFWWSELDPTQRQFDTSDFEENDSNFTFTLENLYPSILYNFTVELLSSVADPEDERLWSEKSQIGARTLSERPEFAPNTTQGSFESLVHLDDRQVWVYWSYPKRELHNGLDFRPRITEVLEEDKPIALTPSDVTKSFANFQLTLKKYSIFVTSENENGSAPESSEVIIPNHSEIKGLRPKSVTKIAYDNHNKLFEISWLPPENKNLVKNYTIFYCKPESGRDRPYQCDGPLDWIIVDSSTLIANITLNSPDLHQFAVAANADHGISSGMIWATCTILSNKVVSKLKNVKVSHVRQTNVEVEWMVDCSDRHVLAYKVSFCVMRSLDANEACLEKEQFVNTTATSKNAFLTGLKPYTYYKLGVSAITRAGESEMSDPEVVQTKPDKPLGNIAITTVVQNDNTISLTCGKPELPNGEINRYRVQYGFVNLEGHEQVVIPILDSLPSCEDAVLNNLMHNVEYFIEVSACNSLEGRRLCGEWTRTQVTTLVGPSSQMPAPEVKTLTRDTLEVSWNRKKFYPGSDSLRYKIHITNTILNKSHESFVEETKKQEFQVLLPSDLLPDCDNDNDTIVTVYNVSILAISIDPDTNKTFDGVWSPVETVSSHCFSDIPVLPIVLPGSVAVFIVVAVLAYKCCHARTSWNNKFFESVKDAPVPGDNAVDGTCVISSALAPRSDQHKKYQRTASKESAQTLLAHPKRNLSGDSTNTSGCESARSSEIDEIEKAGAGDTASIETTEEDNAVNRANFPLDNDMPHHQPQIGWPEHEDVPDGLGYSKVGEEPNHHPLHVISSPPPAPGGSYVAIQDLKAPKPNSGYIAFNQVAKSQRRLPREPLNLNSENIEAPMSYSKVGVDPNSKLNPMAPSFSGYIPHPVVTKPKRLVTLPLSETPQKSDTFKTTPYVTYGGPMVESPTTDPPSQPGPYFQMSSTKPQDQLHELKVNQPDITMSPKNLKVSSMAPFNTAVTALDSSKSSMV